MYLSQSQIVELARLLKTFFSLPYSTDLDGKDAETLIRIVKKSKGPRSKRKELFDIIDGTTGYSVKTLNKSPKSIRVDLQEQRFCDVEEMRRMFAMDKQDNEALGRMLLGYMRTRISDHMMLRGIKTATSIILLKNWDTSRRKFTFKYWEENFLGYIDELWDRNEKGEIEWMLLKAGIHARDRKRQDEKGKNIRLLRMHQKHNQIFTDHDIPSTAITISFEVQPITWLGLAEMLQIK